ncbi:MAG: Cys-tRNA(Pro) deacylase [Vallitaleaceae bacterium]|nr:Cys-tRNA(Pro) deacylase [Vallitaleaceae bacterium]
MKKTNAMRLLDRDKIPYTAYEYEVIDGKTDGLTVAMSINQEPERVYKTLVTIGASRTYYVFVIPVAKELDLKKAAKATGEKKIDMIPMKDLLPTTGYIHGGCSPIGMKKRFKTFIDESCKKHKTILVSGGVRGIQLELNVEALVGFTGAEIVEVV